MPLTPADHAMARGKPSFDCPHCGVYANQQWSDLFRYTGTDDYGNEEYEKATDGGPVKPPQPTEVGLEAATAYMFETLTSVGKFEGEWGMSFCWACHDYSVWRSADLIYPRSSGFAPPSSDMPADVVLLYDEARDVMAVSRRAGAALARATLELLVKKLYPEQKGDLAARLKLIIPTVPTPLGEMLTAIRHIGNKSLHVEDEPDAAVVLVLDETQTELVEVIFESINELVDEKITKPQRSARILALIPEGVRNAVKSAEPKTEI